MPFTNVTVEQLDAAAKACGMKFVPKGTLGLATVDGYLNAKGTQYASTKDGLKHYGPCVCGFKAFRKALNELVGGGWTMTVHKHKISSWGYTMGSKIESACYKAKVQCAHGPASAAITSDVHVSDLGTYTPPAPEPEPVGVPFDVAPLLGEPVTGTVDASNYGPAFSNRRCVSTATATMYVLEELYAAANAIQLPTLASDVPDSQLADYHARIAWARRLVTYRRGYGRTLARNFLDYLTLASYSEVCHEASGYGSRYTFPAHSRSGAGGRIIPGSMAYDPRTLLPRMAKAFRTKGNKSTSYGGEKWAKICDSAGLYFKWADAPGVFADHVVDLRHNGNLAFDKGFILRNPSDESAYNAMLDAKRTGSLLAGRAPLLLSPECLALVEDAVRLRIIARPTARLTEHADAPVPFVNWGAKEFIVYKGAHAPADAEPAPETTAPTPWAVVASQYGGSGIATLAPPRE